MAGYFNVQYEDFWFPDLTAVSIHTEQGETTELDDVVRQFRRLVEDGEEWLADAVRATWRARRKGRDSRCRHSAMEHHERAGRCGTSVVP
jgi:hypothetical protein